MTSANGSPGIIKAGKTGLDRWQQDAVDVLSDALEEALKGRVTAVALVVCMDDGIATNLCGKNGGALNLGCDDLKRKILGSMFGGDERGAGSRIVRPSAR